jgi:hypothetical protein
MSEIPNKKWKKKERSGTMQKKKKKSLSVPETAGVVFTCLFPKTAV